MGRQHVPRRSLLVGSVAAVAAAIGAAAGEPPPSPVAPPRAPLRACFAPGTPERYREEVARLVSGRPGPRFFAPARWSWTATDGPTGSRGTPVTLTWGIVPDGTSVAAMSGGGPVASDLRTFLNGIYGNESVWMPHFEQVFRRWGEVSGVRYVRETADDGVALHSAPGVLGVRPDIRIAGRNVDGDWNVLAFNAYPDDGDMVIDTADVYFRGGATASRPLRNVVAHEHGHGLGLDHVCPIRGTKLMEPSASTAFEGPQHDDIRGAQRLYGDPREPNDTIAEATDLGAVGAAAVTIGGVSIDGSDDIDSFAFTAPEGASADVTLRPFGKQYDHAPQGSGGACGTSERIDTAALVDLRLFLLRADGSTLASADATLAGGDESLLDVPLDRGAARYVVRVRGAPASEVQMYTLEVRAVQRGEKPVAAPDAATTWEALPVTTEVIANDAGLDDAPLSLRIAFPPLNGRAIVDGLRVVYVPRHGFAGDDRYVYELSDVHRQRTTAEVTVTVRPSRRAGFARDDADDDGYPDEFEAWRGTAPDDTASRPGPDVSAGAEPLPLSRVALRLTGGGARGDQVRLRGKLPVVAGFEPAGAAIAASVGGVHRDFTLDASGRGGVPGSDSVRLHLRRRRGAVVGGDVRFDLALAGGDFAAAWADEGLVTDRRQRSEPRAATVFLLFGGRTFVATPPLRWSASRNGTGVTRFAR